MKTGGASLVFLLAAGVTLTSALAGGQVWAMTGSVDAGILSGCAVAAVLAVAARALYGQISRAGRKQMFATTEELQEGEFVEIRDPLQDSAQAVVAAKAQDRPDRVAGSVRAMMSTKNKTTRKR
ncbi:MAG: hypothetical protein HOM68_12865 [Gemmatimonadetes bacterium]|nr:hypothetical protein [Gemmatimonadota bacterium]MBT5057427.1 hypothetical protein [Gemmatimonadota bacterium]MBT5141849.1 hypothetical protein [Gemmatimonadota bacterium]MBT5589862.1 hypothetical protein [Gemmatimonadota bacterium]MBT5963962.1 hypothetical protein [Gemmatimonadota bacterium]